VKNGKIKDKTWLDTYFRTELRRIMIHVARLLKDAWKINKRS